MTSGVTSIISILPKHGASGCGMQCSDYIYSRISSVGVDHFKTCCSAPDDEDETLKVNILNGQINQSTIGNNCQIESKTT